MVYCKACDVYIDLMNEDIRGKKNVTDNVTDMKEAILNYCMRPHSMRDIMMFTNIKTKMTLKRKYIDSLIKEGRLKQTLPDKPSSKNQKYFTVKE